MKKTHKLLAVMIWLGSAQANAETPARDAANALTSAREQLANARASEVAYVKAYLTTPRRLANGAPACGNIMSKDATCDEELADLHDARRLHDVKQAFVRTAKARAQVHEAARTVAELRLEGQALETRPQDLALTVSLGPRPPS